MSLGLFQVLFVILAILSVNFFSHTYDTSWDGEGYHSNAVISFANGWNPVYSKNLPLKFPDASIFVRGYPKALWLIQSSIYLATGDFDAAKVTNLAAMVIALIFCYSFLRKLRLPLPLSVIIAFVAVLHPPFSVQFLSFSEDLFSYEMALTAISALGMLCAEDNSNKNLLGFTLAELMLIGTKFSNLPVAAALGFLFVVIFVIVKMDADNDRISWKLAVILAFSSAIFAIVPYATNYIHYKHPFYPSNYASVNRTFREDNVPANLLNATKPELIFYSIFSRSQVKAMGKNDPQNTASLKIPFTFSPEEIIQSATIYNNRVGAAGPLFSGIFLLSALLWVTILFSRRKEDGKANLYFAVFSGLLAVCIGLTLVNPVPNLLRYNIQVVLIPLIVLLYTLLCFNSSRFRITAYALMAIMALNTSLFTGGVVWKNIQEQSVIKKQLADLRNPAYQNKVWANNFYSNYLRLDEANVPFTIVKNVGCKDMQFLSYSSYTTRICQVKK